jgi:hypothetical protein
MESRLPPHHGTKKCFNFPIPFGKIVGFKILSWAPDSLADFGEWRKAAMPLDCGSVEDLNGPSQFAARPRKG